MSYLGACGCSRFDVEDLCQETYIRAFLTLKECDTSQPFVGWLLGIAHNVCRHHRRRARLMMDAIQKLGLQTLRKAEAQPLAASVDFAEQRAAAVRTAVESLGSPLRAVLFLRFDQHMSIEEIAGVERISIASTKMRLLRARRLLRQRLAQWQLSAFRGKGR
ncbi:MAG: sigma-70 family RNA polymerase sigma factor [Planctomycetes bacterium]|nr:sigma-70 family RNA polymerase sigma factor [Planctomycetota bacterium]MBI3843490.1 sigma-70 family RNA polymerase sigma factor [Planctomycetota bacterium]